MTNKTKQKYLKQLGFYTGDIDGKFGPLSKQATEDFQKSQKPFLEVDGKCGPLTQAQLKLFIDNGWTVGKVKFTYHKTNGKTINLCIDENCLLTKNFRIKEFMMHKDTCKKYGISEATRMELILYEQIVNAAQKLRNKFGSLNVNSGYRNPKYNNCIGGSKTSQHMLGKALDLASSKYKPKEIQAYIRKNYKSLGITRMESKTKPNCNIYTHIDCKNVKPLVEY